MQFLIWLQCRAKIAGMQQVQDGHYAAEQAEICSISDSLVWNHCLLHFGNFNDYRKQTRSRQA